MTESLAAALVGLGAGVLSGAFGVGGGVVTTPAIRLLLGYPELVAVGTPLPVILPTAIAGALTHARSGTARLKIGLVVGLWGMPAAVAGALLSRVIGGRAVLLLTAVVIITVAVDMLRSGSARPLVPADISQGSAPRGLIAIGAITGAYSGLLGLGGGFVLVPLLRRFAGLNIKEAIGTSLVAVAILAVPGSLTHWLIGNVDLRLALLLSIGVIPGAVIGARATLAVSERAVRIAFAVMLLLVGVLLGLSESGVL